MPVITINMRGFYMTIKIEVQVENNWIEQEPKDGDWIKVTNGKSIVKKWYMRPIAPEVPKIRMITKRAFMRRFTQVERIAIRKSVDDIVIDIYDDLKMVSHVDLDLVDTIQSIEYLKSVGLVTTGDILRDGSEDEV